MAKNVTLHSRSGEQIVTYSDNAGYGPAIRNERDQNCFVLLTRAVLSSCCSGFR